MILRVALDAFVIVLGAWFWLHCARPELTARRAGPIAHGLVFGISVLMIVAHAIAAATTIAQIDDAAVWWTTTITGAAWIVVVALGYIQRYGLLIRVADKNRLQRN